MIRPNRHTITDPSQLLAISSPIRAQIIGIMENREAYSVREIAQYLGMQTESVYYHVHQLVKAGLLNKKGRRSCTTRDEAVYQLLARHIYVDWSNVTPAYREALKKAVRTAHRLSERMIETAIDSDTCRLGGLTAHARIQQESARLSKEKLRELIRMLMEIDRFVMENSDPEEETTYVVTASVAPILARE
jgi:predicted ArsR family transcriptional regulator